MNFYLDFPNPVLEQKPDRWDNKKFKGGFKKKRELAKKRILRTAKRLKLMKVMSKNRRTAVMERLEMQTDRYR